MASEYVRLNVPLEWMGKDTLDIDEIEWLNKMKENGYYFCGWQAGTIVRWGIFLKKDKEGVQ